MGILTAPLARDDSDRSRRRRRTRAPRSRAHLATAQSKLWASSTRTSKISPPSTWPRARPPTSKLASAGRCRRPACSVFAVSHRPDGLRHPRFAGLLHPAADPGVHRVSRYVRRVPATSWPFPTGATPSRAFPSRDSRAHVTVGRAPSSSPHLAMRPTSRPCSVGESVAQSTRCRAGALEALLGFPLEASRTPEGARFDGDP
jgi:hypothetical protein